MTDSGDGGLRRAVSVGVRWTAVQTFGTQALQFVVFAVLARLLTPTVFGIIGIAAIFVSLSEVFAGWAGLSSGLVQRTDLKDEDLSTAFWLAVIVTVVFAVILVVTAEFVGALFSEPEVVPVLMVMAFIPLIGSLGVVPSAILQRELRFKELSLRSLVGIVAGGIIGVTMAFAGFGVWAIVGQQLAARIVGTLAVYVATSWRPTLHTSRESRQWLVSFSLSIIGRDIIGVVSRRADNFIIGLQLDAAALGIYRVGYRAFLVVTEVFVRTTSRLALPTLARLQHEPERLRRAYYGAVRLTALIGVPAFCGVAVLSDEVVLAFFGSQWGEAAPVLAALSVAGIIQTFVFFDNSLLIAIGKPGSVVRMTMLNAFLNVIGFVIAIQWGIAAVAVAYSVRALVTAPIWLWLNAKHAGTRPLVVLKQYVWPITASVAMTLAVIAIRDLVLAGSGPILVLTVTAPLGAAIYMAFIWMIDRSTLRKAIGMIRAGGRISS